MDFQKAIPPRDPSPRRKGFPFEILLFLLVPALIVGGIVLAVRATREGPADEVDRGLVETYLGLIADGRYDEAYDLCLSPEYQERISREEFAAEHRKALRERGNLLSREIQLVKSGTNILSGSREVELLYLLRYERGEWRNYLAANDAGGEWRIAGTYRRAAKHLTEVIW